MPILLAVSAYQAGCVSTPPSSEVVGVYGSCVGCAAFGGNVLYLCPDNTFTYIVYTDELLPSGDLFHSTRGDYRVDGERLVLRNAGILQNYDWYLLRIRGSTYLVPANTYENYREDVAIIRENGRKRQPLSEEAVNKWCSDPDSQNTTPNP